MPGGWGMVTPCVCTQVAYMGAGADTIQEFWMKYGNPHLLNREAMYRFCFCGWAGVNHTQPAKSGAYMLRTEECSMVAWHQSIAHVREYLNHVVEEIRWADRLESLNHCPHFPLFMTHSTNPMPTSCIGRIWSAEPWSPKYASLLALTTNRDGGAFLSTQRTHLYLILSLMLCGG